MGMTNIIAIAIGVNLLWALVCFLIATVRRTIYRPLGMEENPSRLRPHEEVLAWREANGRKWIKIFFISSVVGWALTVGGMYVGPVVARGLAPTVTPTLTASPTPTITLTYPPRPTPTPQHVTVSPSAEGAPAYMSTIYPSPTRGSVAANPPPVSSGGSASGGGSARSVQVPVTRIVSMQVTRIVYYQVTRVVTAQPGPSQTPWIIYVQVTELPVESPTLTETPTPTETVTETPTGTATVTATVTETPTLASP
jgi:hypothetical protein